MGLNVLDDRVDERPIVVGFPSYPQIVADTEPELEEGWLGISLAEPLEQFGSAPAWQPTSWSARSTLIEPPLCLPTHQRMTIMGQSAKELAWPGGGARPCRDEGVGTVLPEQRHCRPARKASCR